MVKQKQEQKQNVKVVINLAEPKKKRKPRRRRIREPPQGKSSFQQILRDNQAPQVIVRRIYDQSPYLDELQRLRSQQQGVVALPADGVKQPEIPLVSQAEQRLKLAGAVLRRWESEDAQVGGRPARVGERMSMPTDPDTSALQGTPEPPPVETPAKKPRKINPETDKRFKRNRGNKLGLPRGYGNIYTMSQMNKATEMRAKREQRFANPALDMLAGGTNTQGQI